MIINITDLAKAALDNIFKQYSLDNENIVDEKKYIRVYLKEIA